MKHRVALEKAYILHTRAYRDTSVLLTLFTEQYGKLNAIARGVRTMRSPLKGILQSFLPLLVSWSGKSDLVTLCDAELNLNLEIEYRQPHEVTNDPSNTPQYPPTFSSNSTPLRGNQLWSAMYINELLTRLLHNHDPHPILFHHYSDLIYHLRHQIQIPLSLRLFEKKLIEEIGFGLPLSREAKRGHAIEADNYYLYSPEIGFLPAPASVIREEKGTIAFPGDFLLQFAKGDLPDKQALSQAKRLMRLAIDHLLSHKPLLSREIFHATRRATQCD